MRIVSLLPSTTEIIAALGRKGDLVGRSHECDYPAEVSALPTCTEPKFQTDGSSRKIDQRVKTLIREGLSVYQVNEEQMNSLEPDLIITQDHCEACAASLDDVNEAVHQKLGPDVQVLSVSPTDLSSVIQSIRDIARAIDAEEAAETLTARMKSELQAIQDKTEQLYRPEVLALEWMEPLMTTGNWIPQLIQLAGGIPIGAESGEPSPQIDWQEIRRLDPPIITIMPCGYCIDQTLKELDTLTSRRGWNQMRAVKNRQVYLLDGHHYFNRPGPRLVDSTRILAEIIHPSIFRNKEHPGWINLAEHRFYQNVKNHE